MSEPVAVGIPEWDTADRMRKALRASRVSVATIAEHVGVRRETVSTWLAGRHHPSVAVLRLWALRTGVPYEWLRYGTDDGPGGSVRREGIEPPTR